MSESGTFHFWTLYEGTSEKVYGTSSLYYTVLQNGYSYLNHFKHIKNYVPLIFMPLIIIKSDQIVSFYVILMI